MTAACAELGCPNQPDASGVRCAPCKADTTRGPLYTRPHRPVGAERTGRCEVCGREDYDGIHLDRAGDRNACT